MGSQSTYCHFYGIISSNQRDTENRPYGEYLSNHFKKNGGVIYVQSKRGKETCLNNFKKMYDMDLQDLYNKGNVIFLYREDFLINNQLDRKKLSKGIKGALNRLDKNNIGDRWICFTIDASWGPFVEENAKAFYKMLKDISNNENTIFIIRYVMEELSEECVYSLLYNHEMLLIDGIDDVEAYTPEEFIYKSMTLLSRYNSSVYKYESEMMKLEYLKTLGELVEGIVHDINNLLITILGYAQYALAIGKIKDMEESLRIIQDTAKDGKNIVDIIQNHIRGSNITSRGFHKLNNIVESCIKMTSHKFKPCSVKGEMGMQMKVDLNSDKYIYGNEYEIRQVLINIILNGVDAMKGSGTLSIRTYDVGEKVVLEIEDTGTGMDEITLKKIFNPYFSTKGSNGTGLGLNLAKKVFDSHGAEVKVKSEVNKGTKFTIYFPANEMVNCVAETEAKDYNII